MQWQFLLSLHPNTSEVYKMNTFSFNSVLDPQKCIFLQFQFKIVSAFLTKESYRRINEVASLISFLLHSYMNYYHNKVSGLVSFLL